MSPLKDRAKAAAAVAVETLEQTAAVTADSVASIEDRAAALLGRLKEGGDAAASAAAEYAERLRNLFHNFSEHAIHGQATSQTCRQVAEKVDGAGRQLRILIREYPVSALVVGFGVGWLVGRILGPRASSASHGVPSTQTH